MRHLVLFASLAIALPVGVSRYYAAINGQSLATAASTVTAPTVELRAAQLPIPPAGPIESADMLRGAYTLVRDSDGSVVRAQILDLVWGVRKDRAIGLAIFKAIKENGEVIDYNRPDVFERLAITPAELDNCFFNYRDGSRLAVDHITYRVDETGMMAMGQWIGRDRDGRPFTYEDSTGQFAYVGDDPDPIPPSVVCCRKVDITECLAAGGCTAGCVGTSSCACTSGQPGASCYLQTGPQCRGACGGTCGHTGTCSGPPCACH
jgi:hypothetical protein